MKPIDNDGRNAVLDAHVEGDAAVASIEQIISPPIALLDSSEIIELSIKPSLWFIPAVSGRGVGIAVGAAAMIALAAWTVGGWSVFHAYAFNIALLAGVGRVGIATLQWASRLYLLTNRRVMRFSGVLNVEVTELPLTRVGQTHIKLTVPQRMMKIGSIRLMPIDQRLPRLAWDHVAQPTLVYEKVVRAVRRAQSGE